MELIQAIESATAPLREVDALLDARGRSAAQGCEPLEATLRLDLAAGRLTLGALFGEQRLRV